MGILMWDRIIDYDPTSVYPELKPKGTNPCQPGWASILTPFGIKQFKDIKIGDLIWSKDGWTRIINKQNTGIKKVYEYRTTGGSFYGTENHRLVSNGVKIEAKDADSIDIISGPKEKSLNTNREFITSIVDGLVLGDGSVHKASNNLIYLCIGQNDQDYFTSEISPYIGKHRPSFGESAYEVITGIQSYELPLTYLRRIPERYFYSDNNTVCNFLRGLYSANGSVVGSRVTFKTASPLLRDEIQILLSSIGIRSYYTTNKSKDVEFNNGIYSCKESYDINISTDRKLFYDNIGFIQKYKMNKLESTILNTKDSNKTHDIISVNFISEEEVFDITVDNNSHTYWTGGVNVSNCSELPLGELDSCRLLSTNLYSLVSRSFTKEATLDKHLAYKIFYEAQILADDLVDLELEAVDKILTKIQPEIMNLPKDYLNSKNGKEEIIDKQSDEFKLWWKIREIGQLGRRTGTGITALGDYYAALGVEYGNKTITEELFSLKLQAELDASIDMAVLRGTFPSWDSKLEYGFNSSISVEPQNRWYHFLRSYYPAQTERMLNFGRRNSGISTCAPVGTGSLMTGTTSGIEPLFMPYYTRRKKCNQEEKPDFIDSNGVGYKEYLVVHPKLKEFAANMEVLTKEDWEEVFKKSPWFGQTANDINWERRVDTQSIIQKYITSSISSTVNLPKDTPKEVVEQLYLRAFDKGLKGITCYVDGSRSGVLVSADTKDNSNRRAKPRPKILEADYHQVKAKGVQYIVLVGLLEGKPYEIFTFNPLRPVNIEPHKGVITKIKKGQYSFDSKFIALTDLQLANDKIEERSCTIYASMLLREGANIEHVIKVTKKVNPNISSFASAMCRVLSKYSPKEEIANEVCPECGGKLVRENGCTHCVDCGYSKCS